MKTRPFAYLALVLAFAGSAASADVLFKTAETSLDAMPGAGMAVYQPPQAAAKAVVKISTERPAKGAGCLEIACPAEGYVSVSFPLRDEQTRGVVRFQLRGEVDEARELFVGVQNFTMDGGFKTISAVPRVFAKEVGGQWRSFELQIERDPAATRWQLTFAVRGPGRIWIDELGGEL